MDQDPSTLHVTSPDPTVLASTVECSSSASKGGKTDNSCRVYVVEKTPRDHTVREHRALFVEISPKLGQGRLFHVTGNRANMKYIDEDATPHHSLRFISKTLVGTIPTQSVKAFRKVCKSVPAPKSPGDMDMCMRPGCQEWVSNAIIALCNAGVMTKSVDFSLPPESVQLQY